MVDHSLQATDELNIFFSLLCISGFIVWSCLFFFLFFAAAMLLVYKDTKIAKILLRGISSAAKSFM